jgi:hypothetical protein
MNRIPVVYYHSIGYKNPIWRKNFLTLGLSDFENHLRYITRNYNVISLKESWLVRNNKIKAKKNLIVITFDDGYLDNWIWAFPLLKKYQLHATIFITPEFVDQIGGIHKNMEDYEQGRASLEEIKRWGFLSWEEMKIMEQAGLVDIQSHTLSHTKYFISDKITGFHYPEADALYQIGNVHPNRKPYYIGDVSFEKLLPYGYPFFEEKSALVSKRITINPSFIDECIYLLKDYDFNNYEFKSAFKIIKSLYESHRTAGTLITNIETEEEYLKRVTHEIYGSKKIIEEKLNKEVEFLCWPNGENNETLHKIALNAGYLMTSTGKAKIKKEEIQTRIPERIGINLSSWTKRKKTDFKLKAFSGKFPYDLILNSFRHFYYHHNYTL